MNNEGTVALNNYLQARGQESRLSWAESPEGLPHSPTWTAVCKIDGEEFARGVGSQKHLAKDAAAKEALQKLKEAETT